MSALVLQCPLCTEPFQVSEDQAGQAVKCPSCDQAVMVPKKTETAPHVPKDETVVFACPICSGQFGITSKQLGQQVGCPHCQSTVLIQAPPETQAKPEEATTAPLVQKLSDKGVLEFTTPGPKIDTESREQKNRSAEKGANSARPSITDVKAERDGVAEPPVSPTFVPKNIDHLLPPRFDVIDPEQLVFRRINDPDNSVVLPDGQGGLKKVDKRIVKIKHGGKEITLVALPPEVVRRKRMIQNTIFMIGGAIVLALIFMLLRKSA